MAFSESEADRPKVVAVLGPTACGKSALSLEIARTFAGAIVNCDSRQLYRKMEIGTAAPSPAEKAQVPHHLFGFLSPAESFSAGEYVLRARDVLAELHSQQVLPILVGGTGFYFEALAEGLPPETADPVIREKVTRYLEEGGLTSVLAELQRLDPDAVATIDCRNPRRAARALELVLATGGTLRDARQREKKPGFDFFIIKPLLPRAALHQRIADRTIAMLAAGLEKEVKDLADRYGFEAPGMRSIGYQEWQPFFAGTATREETAAAIVIHTRQYAKRQETWFRHRTGGTGYDLSQPGATAHIIADIARFQTTS
jgi:tRNA dimethylallyltransferase